jgi:hypothetical protein
MAKKLKPQQSEVGKLDVFEYDAKALAGAGLARVSQCCLSLYFSGYGGPSLVSRGGGVITWNFQAL